LPPADQLAAVSAKLRDFNPAFDGNLTHRLDGDSIAEVTLVTDNVSDISPLRAFPNLKWLICRVSEAEKGRLADLWPLRNTSLAHLDCSNNPIADLGVVRLMPLVELRVDGTKVRDLSTLGGTTVTSLACRKTPVSDLSPLQEMALESLECDLNLWRDME